MPNYPRIRRGSRLRVRSTDPLPDAQQAERQPLPLPGFALPLAAGVAVAAAGWLVITGLFLLSWLTERAGGLRQVLDAATQVLLLAHGGGLEIGAVRWTLVPLGITVVLALVLRAVADATARRAVETEFLSGGATDESKPARLARNVTALVTAGYALTVTVIGLLAGSLTQSLRAAVGAAGLAALSAGWGACRGAGYRPADALPDWAKPIPSAVIAATWTVLCGGAAALAVSLLQHRERIVAIAAGLGLDPASTVQVTIAQLLFLPNLVIWAGSWVLGAGFTVGRGSVVSPPSTDLGLLPSIPVLGALPAEGPGKWVLLWLVTGLIAGAVAVAVVIRSSPQARFEQTALVSGLAGVLASFTLTALAVIASGDLGVDRLTGLGPRLGYLVILGGALLGMSGLLFGMLTGLVRQHRRGGGAEEIGLSPPLGDKIDP